MEPDDELCLCFHVTKRKVTNYLRIERPRAVAQLSECYGAGTGCGWCRPFLRQMFEQWQKTSSEDPNSVGVDLPSATDYSKERADYVRSGKGTPPPGATPIETDS